MIDNGNKSGDKNIEENNKITNSVKKNNEEFKECEDNSKKKKWK